MKSEQNKMDRPQSFDNDLIVKNSSVLSKRKKPLLLNSTTNSFLQVRPFKGEKLEIDESWLKENGRLKMLKGVRVKPPTAWPEKQKNLELSEHPSHSKLKEQIHLMSKERKTIAAELQSVQQSLSFQKSNYEKYEHQARSKVLKSANTMVQQLPLQYLYSKPELRHYALEQIYSRFQKLAVLHIHHQIVRAFHLWKFCERVVFDDKQIGFMVISKAFQMMLDRMIGRAFKHWAIFYSKKYDHLRKVVMNEAATEIQKWYRLMRITRTESYRRLWHAVKMCLHRRKAMKYMIRFEVMRRKALIKVSKGIVARRRYHFAARAIQRIYRWICLYRKVSWKLIRLSKLRSIQRWWRMQLIRDSGDRDLIKVLIRAGGYSKVAERVDNTMRLRTTLEEGEEIESDGRKMKKRGKKKEEAPLGLLVKADACLRLIQRAWLRYRGMLSLISRFVDRKNALEYERMRTRKAVIIQSSYRAHLWDVLMLAAVQNNRARRIQRGSRASQYRAWVSDRIMIKRNYKLKRKMEILSNFAWLCLLKVKFILRLRRNLKHQELRERSSIVIQRGQRDSIERMLKRQEKDLKVFNKLRERTGDIRAYVSTIQRNWRQRRRPDRFPYHVKLCMIRIDRQRRLRLHNAAFSIQKLARYYIDIMIEYKMKKSVAAVLIISRLAKAYLLKLNLWDRIEKKRVLKMSMSNKIKRWLRQKIFQINLKPRFAAMKAHLEYQRFLNKNATFLQRFIHRKRGEYYSALRIAGRRQLERRRIREEKERIWKERDKAARCLQKAFRGYTGWLRLLKKAEINRDYYRRLKATRKLQKFARMVLQWARFNSAVEERKTIRENLRRKNEYISASNTIGKYWRRSKEKKLLNTLFRLRRKMIDQYNALEKLRLKAENETQDALDEIKQSQENMLATVAGAWKQGSDSQGRNYYYNFISGESSWVPPENWKVKSSELWVRNKDERDNVFYYNIESGESRWLPPCCVCGGFAERYCGDCTVAYCEADYEKNHAGEGVDLAMKDHKWTTMETDKDVLQPGESHCIECKKRVAKIMCTTCWDPYCADCFRYVHHLGALKNHKPMNYRKAKLGWLCIKARGEDEKDYYVNGTTGETSYLKPEELMTEQEKMHYDNFMTHKVAAEEHVKKIEQLQIDLEGASYERDTILFDAINGTGKIGQLLRNRANKSGKNNTPRGKDESKKKSDGLFSFFKSGGKIDKSYSKKIMTPNPRERSQTRNDYIQSIIKSAATTELPK